MDCEIKVKVKYGWLHSRGHANMYACTKYIDLEIELDLEIIKTNILSKIHDDCFKNVTARVLTRFSDDLARWPSFWPQVTQFKTWRRNHQDKHVEQDSWWLLEKCDH